MRIGLDLIKPKPTSDRSLEENSAKMKLQFDRKHDTKRKFFDVNDSVYATVHSANNNFKWQPGTVVERVGHVIYNILLDNGRLIRSHANQLRQRHVSDESKTAEADQMSATLLDVFDIYEKSSTKATEPSVEPATAASTEKTTEEPPKTAPPRAVESTSASRATAPQPVILRRSKRERQQPDRYNPSSWIR